VSFSYDPADQTLAEIMHDALNEIDAEHGANPLLDAAETLHSKLLLNGIRHHLDFDSDTLMLRVTPAVALLLAGILDEAWDRKTP
jgi:phosphopantetheine adenylyltransferase